jgi:hypothetical protein
MERKITPERHRNMMVPSISDVRALRARNRRTRAAAPIDWPA